MLDDKISQYIKDLSTLETPLLSELTRETFLKALNPRMISGHPQGLVLKMISQLVSPDVILEIGTFTGYSAICLAQGLSENGILHTIERNDEIIKFPKKYFEKAGLSEKIKLHTGDALKIIPTLKTTFDLVFLDGDKKQYYNYYKLCFDKLNSGGIILADNVLWNGKVTDKNCQNEPDTASILKFNEEVKNDNRVEVVILPIRDGISIIRKK